MRRRGFTMIEVLMYAGLASLFLGSMLSVELLARRSLALQVAGTDVLAQGHRIAGFLRRDFGAARGALAFGDGARLRLSLASGERVSYRLARSGRLRFLERVLERKGTRGPGVLRLSWGLSSFDVRRHPGRGAAYEVVYVLEQRHVAGVVNRRFRLLLRLEGGER